MRVWFAIVLALLLVSSVVFADWWSCLPESTTASYVGRQSCTSCHQEQTSDWQGSHHDLAMDLATPQSVLGDFQNATLVHDGITSRMHRSGDKYMIHTEGPDGELADFEVKYVLGVEPLQQYMIEFDRPAEMPHHEIARLQVSRVSWDTHQEKWFYLRPPDVDEKLDPSDDLHWTGIAQRWNNMCADCHSTNLQKNYDVRTQTYHTTFSEIDVSCEACHGPGSVHVELANANSLFWDRKLGYGLAKLKDKNAPTQIHACAKCHSRRRVVYPGFRAGENYYDYFANERLHELTYHADGQILDEVYVFGSYIQSKMFHKSIRCTDCHDPHTARLIHSGNQVCTSCHQHSAGKYDSPAHHRHQPGSAGAQCVSCHMPETTYMAVDPRRDHSLRIPRPDLSVELATPNACSGCHLDRAPLEEQQRAGYGEYADWLRAAREGDQQARQALAVVDRWAADSFEAWYGKKTDLSSHFAKALASARHGEPAAAKALLSAVEDRRNSAIVRSTSLAELARFGSERIGRQSARFLGEPDPQLRVAAVGNLQFLPDRELVEFAVPLLRDPIRMVRVEAGRLLARVPHLSLRGPDRQALKSAIREFERGIQTDNDRANAHLSLGVLYESQSLTEKAIEAYRLAMRVEPTVTGPRSNLAALYDRLATQAEQEAARFARAGRQQAEPLVQESIRYRSLANELRLQELDYLARDALLAPRSAPVQYRYGLSLYLADRLDEAEAALLKATELEPNSHDFALAVALLYQKQGRFVEAVQFAERVVRLRPQDMSYRQLLNELKMSSRAPAD